MAYVTNISLPFADLIASASWSGEHSGSYPFRLTRAVVSPVLPPGMSVDNATCLIGTFSSDGPTYDFKFSLRFGRKIRKGSRDSGEGLDAQCFELGDSLVMIGTEDREALSGRLEWLNLAASQDPIEYLADGFELAIDYVPPRKIFDFHFLIAYNSVASDEGSEWFAVDIPHNQLLLLKSTDVREMSR